MIVFCCYLDVFYKIYDIFLISDVIPNDDALYDATTLELVKLSIIVYLFRIPYVVVLFVMFGLYPIVSDYFIPFFIFIILPIVYPNIYLFFANYFYNDYIFIVNLLFSSFDDFSSFINFYSFF